MADAGKIMITCEGDYDPTTQYDRLSLVNSSGGTYLSKKPVQGVLPADGEFWQKFDIRMATDSDFSETSINPVENRVITAKINEIDAGIGTIEDLETDAPDLVGAVNENKGKIDTNTGDIEKLNTDLAQNADYLKSKNLFDGIIEIGGIDATTGANVTNSSRTRSAHFIEVKPNTQYTLSRENGNVRNIVGYNENKGVISDGGAGGYSSFLVQIEASAKRATFTTSPTTHYIKWYDTNYNNTSEKVQIEEGDSATLYVSGSMSNVELTEEVGNLTTPITSSKFTIAKQGVSKIGRQVVAHVECSATTSQVSTGWAFAGLPKPISTIGVTLSDEDSATKYGGTLTTDGEIYLRSAVNSGTKIAFAISYIS